ncbi:MAG TPA: FecR domain-containing protein [Bacteroidales bacterium]|nr:FecR domain-containing protein [Bacteroidales bacterium]
MEEELIIKYVAQQASPEEEAEIVRWINLTPENKETYCKYLNLWALSSQKRDNGMASSEDIQKFRDSIAPKKVPLKVKYLSLLKYAAIATIALFIGKYAIPSKDIPGSKSLKNQIIVPLGARTDVVLPDGTVVALNAGSKLTYDFSYGSNVREVTLVGEGYFKVAKDKDKPFVVQTASASVKALGTEFNVKAYPEEKKVETILVKGSVLVQQTRGKRNAMQGNTQGVVLKPGQKLSIFDEFGGDSRDKKANDKDMKGKPAEVVPEITEIENPAVETSWKDRRWIVQGEKLDHLAVLLSRRFNVTIQMMDTTLKEYKFSGTIENETIEQIFDIMKLAVPMTYVVEKGHVKWYINTSLEKDYKEVYKRRNK